MSEVLGGAGPVRADWDDDDEEEKKREAAAVATIEGDVEMVVSSVFPE